MGKSRPWPRQQLAGTRPRYAFNFSSSTTIAARFRRRPRRRFPEAPRTRRPSPRGPAPPNRPRSAPAKADFSGGREGQGALCAESPGAHRRAARPIAGRIRKPHDLKRRAADSTYGVLALTFRNLPFILAKGDLEDNIGVSDPLSARERDVLAMISQGLSNKRIARALEISPETVKSHVKHIFLKLEVSTRTEAIFRALMSCDMRPRELTAGRTVQWESDRDSRPMCWRDGPRTGIRRAALRAQLGEVGRHAAGLVLGEQLGVTTVAGRIMSASPARNQVGTH